MPTKTEGEKACRVQSEILRQQSDAQGTLRYFAAGDAAVLITWESDEPENIRELNLHWGVRLHDGSEWESPPATFAPAYQPHTVGKGFATTKFRSLADLSAAATAKGPWLTEILLTHKSGEVKAVLIPILPGVVQGIFFVLHDTSRNKWVKAQKEQNFYIDLRAIGNTQAALSSMIACEKLLSTSPASAIHQWNVTSSASSFLLRAMICTTPDSLDLIFTSNHSKPLILHWGQSEDLSGIHWTRMPPSMLVEGTQKSLVVDKALQTPFHSSSSFKNVQVCQLKIVPEGAPSAIAFVLKESGASVWYNLSSSNFVIEIPSLPEWQVAKERASKAAQAKLADAKKREETDQLIWQQELESFKRERVTRATQDAIMFSSWSLDSNVGEIDFLVVNAENASAVTVEINACLREECLLHWGCVQDMRRLKVGEWTCPTEDIHPPGSMVADPLRAVQTPLWKQTGTRYLYKQEINIPAQMGSESNMMEAKVAGIACVLKQVNGSGWYKSSDQRDILVKLRPSSEPEWKGQCKGTVDQIIEAEVGWDHMTLMHRYQLCFSMIERQLAKGDCESDDDDFWIWTYVWNRMIRQHGCQWLDWQRRYNTKPKDLAHASEVLSCKIARCWVLRPKSRVWLRMTLATMGRGGSCGQAIRDRILDIMHKHKLPETSGNFFEQWHQKLHNNTTPDDIGICLALIRFLETGGNLGNFLHVLASHGITAEKLANYERPIRMSPFMPQCDIGSLIWSLKEYLDILKEVHDALDLGRSAQRVRHRLAPNVQNELDGVLHEASQGTNPHLGTACHRIGRIYGVRKELINKLLHENLDDWAVRDILLLDFSLENIQSAVLQGADKRSGSATEWMRLLWWFSEIWALHNCGECFDVKGGGGLKFGEASFQAILDRLVRAVGDATDLFQSKLGPSSLFLGEHVGIEASKLNVFVDEIIRGTSLFAMSLAAKNLEPIVRSAADLPPWQLISMDPPLVQGVLQSVACLTNIQHKIFELPTILISDAVNGEEEIPCGVQAVLVRSAAAAPDILSHIAVRARNSHVMLGVCFDPDVVSALEAKFQNQWITISVIQGGADLVVEAAEPGGPVEADLTLAPEPPSESALVDLRTTSERYVITMDDFNRSLVGSKSLNLSTLKSKLESILTPRAFALPYGAFQKVLSAPENVTMRDALEKVLGDLTSSASNQVASQLFKEAQAIIGQLEMPSEMIKELEREWPRIEAACSKVDSGLVKYTLKQLYEESGAKDCWASTRQVWASIFALRPWISLAKANRSFMSLNMAVLVQELCPADYAFVLHSKNPFGVGNSGRREMYGEIVYGLGEVLVANYPGRALSWKMLEHGSPEIVAFPAKSHGLIPGRSLIFRSDSNGEDLEGFAGAGLFESIPAAKPTLETVKYNKLRLLTDQSWRNSLLQQIGSLAFSIEDRFDTPMDTEGVVCGNKIVIVQSRPQV